MCIINSYIRSLISILYVANCYSISYKKLFAKCIHVELVLF